MQHRGDLICRRLAHLQQQHDVRVLQKQSSDALDERLKRLNGELRQLERENPSREVRDEVDATQVATHEGDVLEGEKAVWRRKRTPTGGESGPGEWLRRRGLKWREAKKRGREVMKWDEVE